jgi:maleylpyruvate isomerase
VSEEAQVDVAEVGRDIDALQSSQERLVQHLRSLDPVDSAAPSELPDWTIGHVLTHIARNADSMLRMLAGLSQYWKGLESRASDIELGARRPWQELLDDVDSTAVAALRRMRETTDWTGGVQATTAQRPKAWLPGLRRREVEVHHADLGLGYGFADMPADFVAYELRRLEGIWKSRQPMGLTSLPDPVLELPEYGRLAWLFGRVVVAGVEPAGVI